MLLKQGLENVSGRFIIHLSHKKSFQLFFLLRFKGVRFGKGPVFFLCQLIWFCFIQFWSDDNKMTVSGPSSRSDGEDGGGSPNRNRANVGNSPPNVAPATTTLTTVPPPEGSPSSTTTGTTTPGTTPQQQRLRNSSSETMSDSGVVVDEETLIENFPIAKLQKLDSLISNPRWVIPVLPKGELEVLLDYSIRLTKAGGADRNCEPCQRFYREGLLISFTKIMTDEAVSSWRYDIQASFYILSILKFL